jgi:AAHS family 3-hydroxyphenylpropionic acid transporter
MDLQDRRAPSAPGAVASPAILALTVAVCFVLMLAEGYDVQAIGVAAPKLMPALHIAMAQSGELFGIGQWGVVLGAVAGGYCADRWSRRNTLTAAAAIFAAMTLATAIAGSFAALLVVRLAAGLGLGAAIPCVIGLALDYAAPARRVRTVTMIMAGLPIGGAVAAAIAAATLERWGWKTIFYVGGVLPLLTLPILLLVPELRVASSEPRPKGPSFAMLFGEGRTSITLSIWGVYFITLLVIYLLLNWLPTLMISQGFAPAQAQLMSLAFNLAAAAGSVLLGMATDRLGPARTVPLAYFLMLAAAAVVAVASSYGAYLAGFTAMGFLLLGGQNCLNGVIPNFYPVQARTLCVGAAVGTGRIGSVVGPLYAGFVLSAGHGARAVLESIVALVAIAAALVLFLLHDGRRRAAGFGK